MKVNVQFFASARELVGTRDETLELRDGATVKDLLELLVRNHGQGLRDYLYDAKNGELRKSIQLLMGDRAISQTGGLATALTDGCVIAVIPPVGGG